MVVETFQETSLQGGFWLILFLCCYGQEQSEDDAAEGGEEDLEILRQAEGECVGGYPEHGDGLLEDEAPLHAPVHLADVAFDIDGLEEGGEGAAVLADVHVGDFVDGHEDGREGGVHHGAHAESTEQFHPRHRAGHGRGDAAEGCVTLHERRNAETEDVHRQGNPHAEEAPNDKFRGNTETFVVVLTGFHPTAQHLAEGGQDTEFQKCHPQRKALISCTICVINTVKQEEWQQTKNNDSNDNKV